YVNEGATLALKGGGSIASSTVFLTSGFGPGTAATLDISQTTSGSSVAGIVDFFPGGTVSLGAKTLTLTGESAFGGVIQNGGIAGGSGGGLTLGTGAMADLGGNNTYTGATTVQANAALFLSGPFVSIAASSGVDLAGVRA